MCGRFITGADDISWREYCEIMRLPTTTPPPGGGEAAPTQTVAVVRARLDGRGRELAYVFWGLLPSWARSRKEGRALFNVRGETARRKFRDSFERRRCVVPARGFYEWGPPPLGHEKKIPHVVRDSARPLMSLAGLWSWWREPTGEVVETCTVVTTMASAPIQPLHDRMPVVLDEAAADLWLEPEGDPDELEAVLVPFDGPTLEVEPLVDVERLSVQQSLF